MTPLFPIDDLVPALTAQQCILTPNRRLSRHLHHSYAEHQRSQGLRSWHSPRIHSLEGWIQQQWQQLQDQGSPLARVLVLDARQELHLWQQVLEQDDQGQQWLQPTGAARQAQQAIKTLQLWCQTLESDLLQGYIPDDFPLQRWHQQFRQRLESLGAITFTDSVERLLQGFQNAELPAEPATWLVQFQELTPLHQQLLQQAFEQQHHHQQPVDNANCLRLGCDDHQAEIALAAQWTRQILQNQPGALIGIVDPQLANYRDQYEHQLRHVLEPVRLFSDEELQAPLFNISIGTPLSDAAVIDNGLLLLELSTRSLELDEICTLLYSPFIPGTETEVELRVALEQRLRRLGHAHYSLQSLIQQLSLVEQRQLDPAATHSADQIPPSSELASLLQRLSQFTRQPYRSLNDWGRWAIQQLRQLGWPGARRPSSIEYQQISQWYELLAGFGRFDLLLEPMSLRQGLKLLRTETQQLSFQPQVGDSAVQVLGPLEAAGLRFTHLWICGLSDERWPESPSPNPLLPSAYQQTLGMPHASAERELEFCRQLTQLFAGSANQVVLSYPEKDGDQLLRPSGLIRDYPAVGIDQLPLSRNRHFDPQQQLVALASLQQQAPLEQIDTRSAPAVDSREAEGLGGGSALLANQSLCPFSAFAIHRLGAQPLEQPQLGLNAAQRGNIVHEVMEALWRHFKDQQALRQCPPEQLQAWLGDAIQQALRLPRQQARRWMGEYYWQLEQRRLETLIQRWLATELERPPFAIAALEKPLQTEIRGLRLKLRIDRIDQLPDDSQLLIDYKTGRPGVTDWFSDRPRQPQLPLYQYATRHPVTAMAFGQIHPKHVGYVGLYDGQNDSPADGIGTLQKLRNPPAADWQQLTQQWRTTLEQLASDFLAGNATVDPLDPNAYRYSKLEPLNRYYEQVALQDPAAPAELAPGQMQDQSQPPSPTLGKERSS
ncbi:PD-(D/E)XK nuclease family protein [Motiliproteus sp.]|uniref:PD-(D/E)XK nuclease family protein n=1 Tax=Motiliproteus sp. TaxID=1898955 RepID=UPI003BAA3514